MTRSLGSVKHFQRGSTSLFEDLLDQFLVLDDELVADDAGWWRSG